jgi:hypothetical protein
VAAAGNCALFLLFYRSWGAVAACGACLLLLTWLCVAPAAPSPPASHPPTPQSSLNRPREFRGPVTGLAGLEGYLLLASGNRIETCVLSRQAVACAYAVCLQSPRVCFY